MSTTIEITHEIKGLEELTVLLRAAKLYAKELQSVLDKIGSTKIEIKVAENITES